MDEVLKSYSGKTVLVTGGLGFIGSNLVHTLARNPNTKIVVVDSLKRGHGSNPFNLQGIANKGGTYLFDIGCASKLYPLLEGVDFVFNLAGQVSHTDSMARPLVDAHSNYMAHLTLLEGLRRYNPKARIIYSSTRQVYGRPSTLPVNEEHPVRPIDINGVNKFATEQSHLIYHSVYGISATVLRLTNTYGPRQLMKHDRQGFIACFIRKAIEGEVISIFGDGNQLRGLNHVDDVIRALLLVGVKKNTEGQIYNLGCGQTFTLKYLADTLIRLTGKGSYKLIPFPPDRLLIDIGSYLADYSKLKRATGWEPEVELEQGLRSTILFYQRYKKFYWGKCSKKSTKISITTRPRISTIVPFMN